MNWLDIILAVVIGALGIAGLWQGLIRSAFGIAGLIVGIILAGRYYDEVAALLPRSDTAWIHIAAYCLILLATLLAAGVIGWLVAKLAHFAMLGWLDKLLGFVFGAATGSLICAAVLVVVAKYLPGSEAAIAESVLARFLLERFPLVLAFLAQEFDFIRDFFARPTQLH